ncbi:MAG: hypothetical protein KBS35_00145, partial [Mycoplasma sp.]|nr:hypothetical protein [Candidatus Hennigella equi]
ISRYCKYLLQKEILKNKNNKKMYSEYTKVSKQLKDSIELIDYWIDIGAAFIELQQLCEQWYDWSRKDELSKATFDMLSQNAEYSYVMLTGSRWFARFDEFIFPQESVWRFTKNLLNKIPKLEKACLKQIEKWNKIIKGSNIKGYRIDFKYVDKN